MKRGVGVSGLLSKQKKDDGMKALGTNLEATRLSQLQHCAETLRTKLSEYAAHYESDIRSNPELRKSFREMCESMGVDMLSSQKSLLANTLGLGDFYYELAVQVIEQCILTRRQNGGTMPLEDLLLRLQRLRPKQSITENDIVFALTKLGCFGSGYVVNNFGGRKVVTLAGRDAGCDTASVLNIAATLQPPRVTQATVVEAKQWSVDRAQRALDVLLWDGLSWFEEADGTGKPAAYWFPCFMNLS